MSYVLILFKISIIQEYLVCPFDALRCCAPSTVFFSTCNLYPTSRTNTNKLHANNIHDQFICL